MNLKFPFHQIDISADDKVSSFDGLADIDLWRAFKNGDDGAFVFIYRKFINPLYSIGIQLADDALVKDCLHDFFLELRERSGNLSDTDNIKLYLFKSFKRRVVAHIKKQRIFVFSDSITDSFRIEFAIDEKIINAQFKENQLKRLKIAMEKLSSKEREIIYFYYFENMSYQEIADMLNYDHVSSARRSLYKVLKKLRKFMPMFFILSIFVNIESL